MRIIIRIFMRLSTRTHADYGHKGLLALPAIGASSSQQGNRANSHGKHIDLGGGPGIHYRDEAPLAIANYVAALLGALCGRSKKLIIDPRRLLVGNAGVLLKRAAYLKHGEEMNFAIADAAINDLMRPALYDVYHEILPVQYKNQAA